RGRQAILRRTEITRKSQNQRSLRSASHFLLQVFLLNIRGICTLCYIHLIAYRKSLACVESFEKGKKILVAEEFA
ncbi:hypothetical protein SDJN02_20127, partial [Cucurbita argyrosperma subsp. argyrosperma]